MTKQVALESARQEHGSLATYVMGFVLSLALTVLPYLLVTHHSLTSGGIAIMLLAIALVQLAVQLIFFLHLGEETRPRWRVQMFAFAFIVVIIVVVGSMWIMQNLNYRMGHLETDTEIIHDEGFKTK